MNNKVFEFLSDLERNNNRDWFAQNKQRYQDVRKTVEEFVSSLIVGINAFDSSIDIEDASKTLFRISRDTRFSINKEPYKINFGSVIVPTIYRRSNEYPGYYLHFQNNANFISMGVYMPSADTLKLLRSAIDEDFDSFSTIIKRLANSFGDLSRSEGSLQRIPKGFDKDSPAAEYLKMKNFYVFRDFSNEEVLSEDFLDHIISLYKESYALKTWLVKAIC
jgi:uncharacterized protein (TIGR02453 family)